MAKNQIFEKKNFYLKNINVIPSKNFKINLFYKRKFNKKLKLGLKFHAEHVKHELKAFYMH